MFKISMVTLASALASISVLAAPEVSKHEQALRKAKNWSDMTAQLKGRMPSNVVKEFAEFAKDEEFPVTRRIKNKLVITETDGTKVIIEYQKNGGISLNGKEWKLRPLATVEEEVNRLALFIAGETKASSGLFGLFAAAQAGGAAVGGAAIAAFAGANAWKAESCGEEELSKELVNDCPLMAVKMKPILASTRKIENQEEYLPISLKCPRDNAGVFELISKNGLGDSDRVRISYDGQSAKKVSLAAAPEGLSFEEVFGADLEDRSLTETKIRNAKKILNVTDPILKEVCLGPKKNKDRYFASLKANREDLRVSSSTNGGEEDEKSAVEAL